MSSNALDYFATLGRKTGPFACKPAFYDDREAIHPANLWKNAIVDIVILGEDDELPEHWELLDTSVDDNSIPCPHIAILRRNDSPRLDHVAKLLMVQVGGIVPKEYILLDKCINGNSAVLNEFGFLAFQRAGISCQRYIKGDCIISDMCIVTESEAIPDGYGEVEVVASVSQSSVKKSNLTSISKGGNIVACRQTNPVGICDLAYEYATIDRYPRTDYKGSELPVQELPMFTFPNDLRLTYSASNEYPLPKFFSFVFTDVKGDHLYAACLRFSEIVAQEDLNHIYREVYGKNEDTADNMVLDVLPSHSVFCPKVICVISKLPYYRAMRTLLKQIYSMSISPMPYPMEFYIASLIGQVPLPVCAGRPLHAIMDAALVSSSSKTMAPVIFDIPMPRYFPHMDLDFAAPLRCLSVDNMLAVFTYLLRETKVVFLCSSNTLLTEVMECLRCLLFPLTWSSCFVSRLPVAMSGLLQAPGGFMIGMHLCDDQQPESFPLADDQNSLTKTSVNLDEVWVSNLTSGTIIVDLTCNSLNQFDGNSQVPLTGSDIASLLRTLPPGPLKRLRNRLQVIAVDYRLGPQEIDLEQFDSAFDFQAPDDLPEDKTWADFPTFALRDSFMVFMVDILGNYPQYIIDPVEDLSADCYRTFKEAFSLDAYLADADPSIRPMIQLLTETQMFAVLLQQRSEGGQYSLVFFEQAAALMRELGLCAEGHGVKITSTAAVADLPLPLHKLLAAECRLSALLSSNACRSKLPVVSVASPSALAGDKAASGFNTSSPARKSSSSALTTAAALKREEYLQTLVFIARTAEQDRGNVDCVYDAFDKDLSGFGQRQELDLKNDLVLHDYSVGPLVIPGPIAGVQLVVPATNKDYVAGEKHFLYLNGWPTLSPEFIDQAQMAVHGRLQEIRAQRVQALQMVNSNVLKMIRAPSDRLNFAYSHKLHMLPLRSAGNLPLATTATASEDTTKAVVLSSMDSICLSIILLASRILFSSVDVAFSLMYQILGIISQVEHLGLIGHVDETVWRSVLVACSHVGGEVMRHIACGIFEFIQSAECKISPDALTYGEFIKAFSTTKQRTDSSNISYVDNFFFFEEIGQAWYKERVAPRQSSAAGQCSKQIPQSPSSSSKWSSMMGMSPRSAPSKVVTSVQTAKVMARNSSAIATSREMALVKSSGMLSLMRPFDFVTIGTISPRNNVESEQLLQTIHQRRQDTHKQLPQPASAALAGQVSPNSSFKAAAPPPSPATPGSDGSWSKRFASALSFKSSSKSPMSGSSESTDNTQEMMTLPPAADEGASDSMSAQVSKDVTSQLSEVDESKKISNLDIESTQSPCPKFSSAQDIQEEIRRLLGNDIQGDCEVVAIHSQTKCLCGHAMLDEEIKSAWMGLDTTKKSHQENCRDIYQAHILLCPQCGKDFVPQLHIRSYRKCSAAESSASVSISDQVELCWSTDATYLSPYGLRFRLEEVLESMGDKALDCHWLREHCGDVFWGLVWSCSRACLPTGFIDSQHSHCMPVIVGWREHINKARAACLLHCTEGTSSAAALTVADFFPGCTPDDKECLDRMVENLNGSLAGMRTVMLEFMKLSPQVVAHLNCGDAMARQLYMGIFTLVLLYKQSKLACPLISDVPDGVSKGIAYDQCYHETITCNLSKIDAEVLKCSQKEMIDAMPSLAARAVRLGHGFLY